MNSFVIPAKQNVVIPAEAGIQALNLSMSRIKQPCVYILANRRNGTLYVGVTSDLVKRVWQHKNDLVSGFSKKYGTHLLVWYETYSTMKSAIVREKAIKEWQRLWKLALIEKMNPDWFDLYDSLL